ncbi:MAG TPA: DUF1080 domain-containing protein [Flavitalea sp.]|nr:DUF1080 domain-containing protein [Flavitalea sp.]
MTLGDSIELFNKKNLDGWYTYLKYSGRDNDPKKVFTVHDSMIHITGEEYGCITSNEEYSNYKLEVQYKWGDKTYYPRETNARDNGILLHSVGKDGGFDSTWMHSIECQVIEGGTGDFIVVGDGSDQFSISSTIKEGSGNETFIYSPHGKPLTINKGRINWFARDPEWKDIKGFRGKNDIEKNTGEWNTLECIADKDKITTFLNGKLVNEATNVHPSKGRIQIQSEGAEIFFRKITLYRFLN